MPVLHHHMQKVERTPAVLASHLQIQVHNLFYFPVIKQYWKHVWIPESEATTSEGKPSITQFSDVQHTAIGDVALCLDEDVQKGFLAHSALYHGSNSCLLLKHQNIYFDFFNLLRVIKRVLKVYGNLL